MNGSLVFRIESVGLFFVHSGSWGGGGGGKGPVLLWDVIDNSMIFFIGLRQLHILCCSVTLACTRPVRLRV